MDLCKTAPPQVEVKDKLPHIQNTQIYNNLGTRTHPSTQTKEHQNMIKEWVSQSIPTKSQRVNLDSKIYQQQQMDFRDRNNYKRPQESTVYKTMDSKVTHSSMSSSSDDLGEFNKLM